MCPGYTTLLAQMRYRLRKEHGASRQEAAWPVFLAGGRLQPAARSLDSQETCALDTVEAPGDGATPSDGSLNCHGYGSIVSVTSTFGLCAAVWAS
jgi:tRNA A37 threonylcarbamoyladenosine dehydratase